MTSFHQFFKNKKVFVTGHTGFKGSWLSIWLHSLGAKVYGYALSPNTEPNLFTLTKIDKLLEESIIADIRNFSFLKDKLIKIDPDIIIHMAAQPLVRESYKNPLETYEINVMGTANLLEAVRACQNIKAIINVTTDKCYENKEWLWAYRENEPLGGYDPYSSSKACSELVTATYRNSFFNPKEFGKTHQVALASARAGNVIGGGDWAEDRLIPDFIRAILKNETIKIRNPQAIRPWQHVLEPLSGYLLLAKALFEQGPKFATAWNFGPEENDAKSVSWIIENLAVKWPEKVTYEIDTKRHPHEANYLKLDCAKAKAKLGWLPCWNLDTSLDKIIEWVKVYKNIGNVLDITLSQIKEYEGVMNV